jgi:S-adenosyl methyltransferase
MMIRKHEPRVPEGVDVTRPSIARIYDYLLFGKDNFAADRAAAEKLMQSRLDPRRLAEATTTYAGARMPFTLRSRGQIMDLFEGFELIEPGLVSLPEWQPDHNTDRTPLKGPTVAAVARLAA